jgi:hypothetical protein
MQIFSKLLNESLNENKVMRYHSVKKAARNNSF